MLAVSLTISYSNGLTKLLIQTIANNAYCVECSIGRTNCESGNIIGQAIVNIAMI